MITRFALVRPALTIDHVMWCTGQKIVHTPAMQTEIWDKWSQQTSRLSAGAVVVKDTEDEDNNRCSLSIACDMLGRDAGSTDSMERIRSSNTGE